MEHCKPTLQATPLPNLGAAGAAVRCLLQADSARVSQRVLPHQRSPHLLLPGGRLHLGGGARCGEQVRGCGQGRGGEEGV